MKYKVIFTDTARKQLKKMDKSISSLIIGWIEKNIENCENSGIHGKSLTANRIGQWRYRIGDYRVICQIDDYDITVFIIEIGHRRNIYNK